MYTDGEVEIQHYAEQVATPDILVHILQIGHYALYQVRLSNLFPFISSIN